MMGKPFTMALVVAALGPLLLIGLPGLIIHYWKKRSSGANEGQNL